MMEQHVDEIQGNDTIMAVSMPDQAVRIRAG